MEHLTNLIEEDVEKEMARIEQKGGMLKNVIDGSIQADIARQAYETERKIESGEKVVVGENRFVSEEKEYEVELRQISADVREKQILRLRQISAERNHQGVQTALANIKDVAKGTGNLMIPILSAVRQYATIGEMCGALKEVFGEYRERIIV